MNNKDDITIHPPPIIEIVKEIEKLPDDAAIYIGDVYRNESARLWFDTDELKALVAQLTASKEEKDRWRIALESLTAQGSEFYNDLDRCVGYVRERYNERHEALKQEVRLKRELEASKEREHRLVAALEQSRQDLGKVAVYPWDSEDDVEAHVIESLARIDQALKGE